MVYTKEDFKRLWEANSCGSGITYDDIADCAKAWGISSHPRTRPIDEITYRVLKAAGVNDAEEYNPNPAPKESEEVRIKREILELVSIAGNGNQFEEIKDWLDKQGEGNHPHWISVEDELPHGGVYLFCNSDGDVFIASDEIGSLYKNITHWMPLPKPPKKGGKS